MKPTLTLLTTLLLAPLALLHAQTASDAIAAIASRKPSGTPLAPVLNPGPEFADGKRIWQGAPSIAISPRGRIWLSWMTGGGIHFKSQLKDGVQEITIAPPANVKLTVIVPEYATSKNGPLTTGTVREDGWRELPLISGKPTTLRIPSNYR